MKKMLVVHLLLATLCALSSAFAETRAPDPLSGPAIETFLGEGFGARNPQAPAELEQFGRLVGLWSVETEMARQGGGWAKTAPGTWAWKFVLDGFAVSDLWYQSADNLPTYMESLGRDYLLTANRVYDVRGQQWRVAWMANGAGAVASDDAGEFTAKLAGQDIVMDSASQYGLQRVVFSEISDDSFRWSSSYSQDDGKSWTTIMRMHATRIPTKR
jgi:hypothetical protein